MKKLLATMMRSMKQFLIKKNILPLWKKTTSGSPYLGKDNNLTIVIQGPLHGKSLAHISDYQKFGKVVMCCWDTWNLADVPPGVELIVLKEEDYNFGCPRNNCNLYKQALTTFHGLRHVRTDFALKVRTDEYYTDLTFILDSLNKDPSKVVIGNTMFGRNHWDFSDHLYAGKTYMLLQTLATVLDYCEERDFNFHIHHPNCNETVLLSAMLKALDKVNLDYPTAIKENFVLAPSQKLGDFYAVSNVCKVEFTPANIEDGYLTIQSFDHL